MARLTLLELREDFLALEDRDSMLCHQWLLCAMDKHHGAGNKSILKKKSRDAIVKW
jgi:hypothetical protein